MKDARRAVGVLRAGTVAPSSTGPRSRTTLPSGAVMTISTSDAG